MGAMGAMGPEGPQGPIGPTGPMGAAGPTAPLGTTVVPATSFNLAPDAGASSFCARADHTHGSPPPPPLPTLGGDVTGPVGATTVTQLQGRAVSAPNPSSGDVLTWTGTTWNARPVPPPPLPPLGGDVTGPLTATTVTQLQGRALAVANPAIGDVLTWTGTSWVARPVPSPPAAPVTVIAAGIVSAAGNTGPVIGGLRVIQVSSGLVTFTFTGYVQPSSTSTYVVKVTPLVNGTFFPLVAFQNFSATGFTLQVRDTAGLAAGIALLSNTSFMVEVSQVR